VDVGCRLSYNGVNFGIEAVADVGNEYDDRGRQNPFGGYEPTRPPRLRGAGDEPPPLPPPDADHGESFGQGDEDGLRMLAALETLTSLEPDYSDEIAAEASVTIIESAGYDAVAEALSGGAGGGRSLRAPPHDFVDAPLHDYDDFSGPGDEATVEIVEGLHTFDAPEPARGMQPGKPSSLGERIAAATGQSAIGGRFFKALSGGS
jgi:hypothetical protein